MSLPKLKSQELSDHLEHLPGWELVDNALQKQFQFTNFVRAMQFVNEVAENAESVNHHPDILVNYNKVTLTLTTHDSGGITKNDVEFAASADGVADATAK
jgi:4a-hydroxytetrahydrobiopterin dehydratase